jgi:outer membrane receptor for ferrienterochelin and colicin
MTTKFGSRSLLVALAMMGLMGRSVEAQTPVTGSISGYVTDENRKPLPGVTVTVRDPDKAGETTVVSDAGGYYAFPVLEPSRYTVRVTLTGFHEVVSDAVAVGLGGKVRLDFMLNPQTKVAETVDVRAAAPLIEPTETSIKNNITYEQFDNLPILGRNFQNIVDTLPGVTQTGRNFNISGSRDNQNIFLIDGARNDDLSNSSTRFRTSLNTIIGQQNPDDAAIGLDSGFVLQSFNQDAIGEIQVVTSAYSAEYGQGSGGVINLVTRSGSDRLNGGFTFNFQDDSFNNKDNIDDLRRAQESVFFGGPIQKGRTWYFASYERDDYRVGYDKRRKANPAGPFGGLIRPFAYDLGIPQSDTSRDKLTGKVTTNPARDNALNVTVNYVRGTSDFNSAINRAAPEDIEARHGKDSSVSLLVNDFHSFSKGAILYSLVKFGSGERQSTSDQGVIGTQPIILNSAGATVDFYVTGSFGELIDADLKSVEWKETYTSYFRGGGQHALKLGFDWERFSEQVFSPARDIFVSNNQSPTGEIIPVSSIPAPTSQLWAFFATGTGSDEAFDVDLNLLSVFLQDDWDVTPRISINAGLRYDYDDFIERHQLSPRIHTAISLTGDSKTVLRAGTGIFRDRSTLLGIEEQVKKLSRGLNLDKATGAILSGNEPGQNVFLTDDFQSPVTYQANVGVERDLGGGYVASANFIWKKLDNLVWTKIINETPALGGNRPDLTIPANSRLIGNFGNLRDALVEFMVRKSFKQGTFFNANYTFEDTEGNTSQELAGRFETVIDNFLEAPDQETLKHPADYEVRHSFKVSGVVRLPLDFAVSPIMKWRAGKPWTPERRDPVINGVVFLNRFIAFEGYNARRLPEVFQLDLRVQKSFRISNHVLEAYVDAFNLTDRKNVASVQAIESFANFAGATSFLQPRTVQIGGKWRF